MTAIPEVVSPASPADYLEVITQAVFQTGVSWKQIAIRWDSYREALCAFDPQRVAGFTDADIERILDTPGILRSPRKIRATIHNAQALLALDGRQGGIVGYLRAFDGYAELAKDLKRRFSFMGDMNAWYFLFRTGEPVPRFDTWVQTIPGTHPRMREMVELARRQGRSNERP